MRLTALLFTLAPTALIAQARSDTTSVRRDTAATLEAVTVTAIRGGAGRHEAPISAKSMDAGEIERRNFGQDMPLLLQGTPSLSAYSEAGNYWGYSYLRMRGIDQSRINLTIDGIPLNDPEDQVLYFADFPDLANSISSIQVQRGVGSSAPGTASYGGSINFQTIPLLTTPRAGQLQLQGGAFGSARVSAEYASGFTSSGVALYGRVSALQSAGYRKHSGMEGRSAFLSAGHFGKRHVLKLTAMAGLFADTLSYLGATEAELAQDRRHNPLRADEVDRFAEHVTSLSYARDLGGNSSISTTLYRLGATGHYDVCINRCDQPQGDLWNFNLDFAWYGATTVWSVERDRMHLTVGANANTYDRDHHAYARPDLSLPLYFNTGHKDDASAFAKISYDLGAVTLFGDVQGRHAEFAYTPDANAGIPRSSIAWSFLNPKIGATVRLAEVREGGGSDASPITAYASYGINSREPARSDMFAGFDNLDTTNATFVGPLTRVRPERVRDLEAGLRYRGRRLSLDANAFGMEFRNEILPIGQLSYIGTPLRTNVRASWRRGMEADLAIQPFRALQLGLTATAMRARIANFTDDETGQSYKNVEPLLTPNFMTSHYARLELTRALSATLSGQYSGRSQLTNTSDPSLTLAPYYVANVAADWSRGAYGLSLYVNNATNSGGNASGHVSFGEARYYVLPPFNVFLLGRLGL
ncbi:MAG: TonB-dependent receptor [Gemmatimonadaceae bacterium]